MAEQKINFIKMNGLGNDFVILDGRASSVSLTLDQVQHIASRENAETGGCDQLIVMENSENSDIFMRIYNADGGEVDACGNASRCIAYLLAQELGRKAVTLETNAGQLKAQTQGNFMVSVNIGPAKFGWQEIPLSEDRDTLNLQISEGELADPVGVNVGNPHAVFFVDDADAVNLEEIGPKLEHHELFPQRANINVAQILDRNTIKLRVWERGVGETKACGTGACATLVAAVRRELVENEATIRLKGGDLQISWEKDQNNVIMVGEVSAPVQGMLTL